MSAAAIGFSTAFALILAIGAQNAFVLRQGLMRQHVLPVCTICALSDAALILAGVAGFSAVTARYPSLPLILTWAGAAFLFGYGLTRFRAAYQGTGALTAAQGTQSLRAAILTCLAFTWLNPHVYLDTLGLIGAVSTGFEGPAKTSFTIGAMTASLTFFFSLGYGARFLSPLMASPKAWVWLDAGIGVLMWALALGLILTH
ncbi:MAG: LysE/ArgO family amino acid transporter [Pseudomonadota bacterium]